MPVEAPVTTASGRPRSWEAHGWIPLYPSSALVRSCSQARKETSLGLLRKICPRFFIIVLVSSLFPLSPHVTLRSHLFPSGVFPRSRFLFPLLPVSPSPPLHPSSPLLATPSPLPLISFLFPFPNFFLSLGFSSPLFLVRTCQTFAVCPAASRCRYWRVTSGRCQASHAAISSSSRRFSSRMRPTWGSPASSAAAISIL